jgi:hypothetical protein
MSTSDFIGRIDLASRTPTRIDCRECSQVIYDDAEAYVYFDVNDAAYSILCQACHLLGI